MRGTSRALAAAVLVLALSASVHAGVESDLEEGVGNFLAQAFIAQRGRLSQPPIDAWIADMASELVAACPRRDLDYHFIVLDSPEANGFALPGGWVFITAGLLESARSDDEIAAVIAHELGHLVDHDFQRLVLRTLLWLGVAELVRDVGSDDLVPLVQGVQLVNTLRHSRRQEAQADDVGCVIAWRAGYDPTALVDFLGTAPAWSYLETVFATHPHPERRATWIRKRVAALRSEDPAGTLRLARALIRRCRPERAERLLAEPLPGEYEQDRVVLRAQIKASFAGIEPQGDAAGVMLSDKVQADLATAISRVDGALANTEHDRAAAWRRLRALWDDGEIERALLVAQAADPELGDASYLALLVQAVKAMHRVVRGGNLVARTLALDANTANGLRALAGDLGGVGCEAQWAAALSAVAQQTTTLAMRFADIYGVETRELAQLAADYHELGRMVAPLLLELASSGPGDPMGRLTFGRFMILQGRVAALRARLAALDERLDLLAATTWQRAIELYRLRLNLAGVMAPSRIRPRLLRSIARRTGASPGRIKDAWRAGGGLGDAIRQVLDEGLVDDNRAFSSQLRVTQIVMRLSFRDTQEQVFAGRKRR